MTSRRRFIGSLAAIGGMLFIPMPSLKWYDKGYYGPLTAQQFITKAWNNSTKGSSIGHWPREMIASPQLYNDYSDSLGCFARFVDGDPPTSSPLEKHLMFKSSRLFRWSGDGWKTHGFVNTDPHWCLIIKDPEIPRHGHFYDISTYGWKA